MVRRNRLPADIHAHAVECRTPREVQVDAGRRELAQIQVWRFDELQKAIRVAVQELAEGVRIFIARIRPVEVVALAQRRESRNHRDHVVDLDVVIVERDRHVAHQPRLRVGRPLEANVVSVRGLRFELRIAAEHTCRSRGREDVSIDDGSRDSLIQAELPDAGAPRAGARAGAHVTWVADGPGRRSERHLTTYGCGKQFADVRCAHGPLVAGADQQ